MFADDIILYHFNHLMILYFKQKISPGCCFFPPRRPLRLTPSPARPCSNIDAVCILGGAERRNRAASGTPSLKLAHLADL